MSFIFRPGGTKQPQLKQVPYYTAFNPRSIGGCVLWLDAADTSTITGTSPVTAWQDKSGSNNTMTYTGSPTYRTTSDLKLGCITFNGTTSFNSGTDSMYYSGFSVSQPFTVFVVATKRLSSNINYSFVIEPNSGSSSVILYAGLQLVIYAGTANQSTSPVLSFVANSTRIYSAVFNGSSSLLAYDGNATSSLNPGTASWPGVYLGRDWGGVYDSGDYGEILFYNSALGTTQRQQIESYLAQKWGLTGSLPSDHVNATKPAGIPAVSVVRTNPFKLIAALLSAMSTVYNLSSYSLATIANAVSASSGTVSYIWTASVPTGAKGKNAILIIFFNMYSLTQFQANQYFDYGIYVDGVIQGFGDTGTARYVHTAAGNYALNNGGITYGTNAMSPYQPLIIPLVLAAGATTIQLGIKNSQSALSPIATTQIGYLSNNATSTGTSNTSSYVPQTLFTTAGSNVYTVPTTCSAGTVTGVFVYLWGSGGQGTSNGGGRACVGGAGGFVSGYYACAGGTNLIYIVGSPSGTGLASTGGSGAGGGNTGGQGYDGGGFSGVFLSNASGVVQANAIAIAGGGGGGGLGGNCVGGYGGYPTGGAPTQYGTAIVATAILGGSQTAGGIGTRNAGSALLGAPSSGPSDGGGAGGGGWYGGGSHAFSGVWATGQATSYFGGGGGSSYVGSSLGASPSPSGIGLTSSAVTSNGNTSVSYTPSVPGGTSSTYYPGGTCGYGDVTSLRTGTGAVVIVPAVGANPVSVGVSATLYSV